MHGRGANPLLVICTKFDNEGNAFPYHYMIDIAFRYK